MPLGSSHDYSEIDLRAPASAPGPGGFASRYAPGPLGRAVPNSEDLAPLGRALQFAQVKGPLPIGEEIKTPLLALHALPKSADEMRVFFQGRWKISPKLVQSWSDFAKIIKESSLVDRLILYSHGAPGQVRIGDTERGLEQSILRPLFLGQCVARSRAGPCGVEVVPGSAYCARHHPKALERWVGPRVRNIEFEGCTVGQRPASLATFGKLVGASTVSGFTWFHASRVDTFEIPKGSTTADVAKIIESVQKYLVAGQVTTAEIASKARDTKYTAKLWLEYFTAGSGSTDSPSKIPRGAKVRSEVPEVTVGADGASKLEEQYEEALDLPCARVVVKLDY